jgi:hypothetical protein
MVFGKQGLPLEASPNTFFLISYNVMDAQSLEVRGRSVVALHIAAIHQWHCELLMLLTYQWPYKLCIQSVMSITTSSCHLSMIMLPIHATISGLVTKPLIH